MSLFVTKDNPTDLWLGSKVVNDTYYRFRVQADGKILWANGTSDQDTQLVRTNANELSIFKGDGSTYGNLNFYSALLASDVPNVDVDSQHNYLAQMPAYSRSQCGGIQFKHTGSEHAGHYVDGVTQSLFLVMMQDMGYPDNYIPFIATDFGLWVEKDIYTYGAIMTTSDPYKSVSPGYGGGAIIIGHGFTAAHPQPQIDLSDSEIWIDDNNHSLGKFDTLYLFKADGSTPANLDLGTLTVHDNIYSDIDKKLGFVGDSGGTLGTNLGYIDFKDTHSSGDRTLDFKGTYHTDGKYQWHWNFWDGSEPWHLKAALTEDGQFKLPVNGSGAGLKIGDDTNLYRDSTHVLKTDDNLVVSGYISTFGDLHVHDPYNIVVSSSLPAIYFGDRSSTYDISLYRQSSPAVCLELNSSMIIDHNLNVGEALSVSSNIATSGEIQVVGSTVEGIKLQKEWVNENSSGRLFFCENDNNNYGFSLIYAGNPNPTFGGTAFTLAGNALFLIRHDNSATGSAIFWVNRNSDNINFTGSVVAGGQIQVPTYFKFTSCAGDGGSYGIIGLDAGSTKNFEVYDYYNNRSMFKIYGSDRSVVLYGNLGTAVADTNEIGASGSPFNKLWLNYGFIGELTVTQDLYIDTIYGLTNVDFTLQPYTGKKLKIIGDMLIQKATPNLIMNATTGSPDIFFQENGATQVSVGWWSDVNQFHVYYNQGSYTLLTLNTSGDMTLAGKLYLSGNQNGYLWNNGGYIRQSGGSGFVADGYVVVGTLGYGSSGPLYLDGNHRISYYSSAQRYKENIETLSDCSWLYDLRPVNFDWKDAERAKSEGRQIGLIAEEVNAICPQLTWLDDSGKLEGVHYEWLGIPLLVEVKKLRNRVEALENQLKQNQTAT